MTTTYNINIPDSMDFVVTYVDCSDVEWQNSYSKYKDITKMEKARFTTSPQSLRMFLRGVAKLDYIRKLFLVVASESQVPSYVNRNEVTVVLHSDFIPEEYLPTFNSNTIETFLHRIPGLSDYFIYSCDDEFILNNIQKDQFMHNNKIVCKHYSYKFNSTNKIRGLLEVAGQLVFNLPKSWSEEIGGIIQPQHIPRCYLKKAYEDCYNTYKEYADLHMTRFRDKSNYTHFAVDFWQLKHGIIASEEKIKWKRAGNSEELEHVFSSMVDIICLSDEGSDIMSRSVKYLLRYLPTPCKYEI